MKQIILFGHANRVMATLIDGLWELNQAPNRVIYEDPTLESYSAIDFPGGPFISKDYPVRAYSINDKKYIDVNVIDIIRDKQYKLKLNELV